jgi:hypothetical protein
MQQVELAAAQHRLNTYSSSCLSFKTTDSDFSKRRLLKRYSFRGLEKFASYSQKTLNGQPVAKFIVSDWGI